MKIKITTTIIYYQKNVLFNQLKIATKIFASMIMSILGQTKVAKEEFYGGKEHINIWDVNYDNILISNLTETRNNSKYLIGYLNEVIRPLVLMFSEMSGYVKTFKEKNNKLMSLHITDEKKLLEKYKTI